MNRRDALSRVALLVGGTVIGAEFFLSGCKNEDRVGSSVDFTEKDIAYLDEIAETILPKTDTPGAKDAKVGAFMTVMVKDTYDEKKLYEIHFDYAAQLEKAEKPDPEADLKHAKETIAHFLEP